MSILYAENKIIISDTYAMASIYVSDYTIKGNGEECKLTYFDDDNSLISSTCVKLINSKGVKIFCTKKKKMCKTEDEITSLFGNKKVENHTQKKQKNIPVQASKSTQVQVDEEEEITTPDSWAEPQSESQLSERTEEWEKQCGSGDIQACMNLGLENKLNGNKLKSEEYYEIAYSRAYESCNSGVEDACYKLADFYVYGLGKIKKNNHRANELLHQSCKGGHSYACGNLNKRAKLFYIHTPQKSHLTDSYKLSQKYLSLCVAFYDLDSGEELETCGDWKIDFANRKSVEEAEKSKQKSLIEKSGIASDKTLGSYFALAKAITSAKYACPKGGTHKGYLISREYLHYNFSKSRHVYRSTYKCIKCEATYAVTR